MRRKYKLTGCARFFIFLLIFTPIVLIGVSLYHGNNPLEQVKELLNIEQTSENSSEEIYEEPQQTEEGVSELGILKEQTRVQQNTIDELKKENAELKQQLKEKEREIQLLKQ